MKKIKLLITGSGGFIMGNYIRRLIYLNNRVPEQYNYLISSIDCAQSNKLNCFYNHKNHNFHVADITDKHILDFIFKLEKPDIVIHAAALTADTYLDFDKYVESNVIGTENILQACKNSGVKKLLYLNGFHWNSEPQLNHDLTKSMADLLIKKERGRTHMIISELALPRIFGPRQNISEMIPKIIKSYLNKSDLLYYDMAGIQDLLHIFDVCSAINLLINNGSSEKYILSNNNIINFDDVNKFIYENINNKIKTINLTDSIEFTKTNNSYRYDTQLINNLGWKSEMSLSVGIIDTINWYSKNKWALE